MEDEAGRDHPGVERQLFAALVMLVTQWTAIPVQGRIARDVGIALREPDVRVLYTLGLVATKVTPSALAERMGLTRPTMSKTLSRLQESGLVTRVLQHDDGRSRAVMLTSDGRSAYDRLVADAEQRMRSICHGVSEIAVLEAASLVARAALVLGESKNLSAPHATGDVEDAH